MFSPKDIASVKAASDYVEILIRIVPVMCVGGTVAVITQLRHIAEQRTWARRTLMCLSVLGVGCVSGGLAVLGLSLFLPTPTVEFDIVAAAVAGSAGQKTFDIYGYKIFGWKLRCDNNRVSQ